MLRAGTDPDFPPFEYVNETINEINGIDADLVKAVAERPGVLRGDYINKLRWPNTGFNSWPNRPDNVRAILVKAESGFRPKT